MITFLWIILFIVVLLTLAYKRASLSVASIGVLFYLLIVSQFSTLSITSKTVLWTLYFLCVIPLNIQPLRRLLITRYIFHFYQKIKPAISATEKEALTIGTVGWEGEFFKGDPDWEVLKKYPAPQLTHEEKLFLDQDVDQLCKLLDNWDITHYLYHLPEDVWQFMKERGFFSLIIPKQYGGKGFSALAHSAVIMKIASKSNAAATVVGVPNSLGPAELLMEYGTDAQKNHYLPRLATGEEIPCFALTGPDAGSDASAMTDSGIVCHGEWQGEKMLGIRLCWDKRYITLAPVATLLGLAFKLFDPDHLLGDKKDIGITCALIPTKTPGVVIGRRHFPLYCAFPNGPTQGKDVFIPLDFIIGGTQMAGKGWHMLIERLSVGRAITLPSLATGGAKVAAFVTGAYARIRRQFHMEIGRFEGVGEALTQIAGDTYIMDATRLLGVAAVDKGECPAVPSSISKYNTTELARQVINDAMDVQGGKGICMGPRNYLAQNYIEAPIAITVEGANILTRCMMIFSQGVIRCHPYLLLELSAAENPDRKQGLKDFDDVLFKHLGFLISNRVRASVLGFTRGHLVNVPADTSPVLKRYYQQITRFSAAFAFVADIAVLTLGGEFKRREHLSGRLADVLSMLYMSSAVLKHFQDEGSPIEDLPIVEWSCQTLLFKLQTALNQALLNFPKPRIGKILRASVFPLGCDLKAPRDTLGDEVSVLLCGENAMRDRLTAGIYKQREPNNEVGLIGDALTKVLLAEHVEKKIQQAVKDKIINGKSFSEKISQALKAHVITPEEHSCLENADKVRREVCAVDDFAPEEL